MDDCWAQHKRDAQRNLQPSVFRFPGGMKPLADYIHSKGLKLGLYTCVGKRTCRDGRPGSWGHYEQDAKQFAEWGIDFVKADNCARPAGFSEYELYSNLSKALNATGRPILFSLCEWGDSDVQRWGGTVGQMYRIQADHLPFWETPKWSFGEGYGEGVLNIANYISTIHPETFVRQYAWMDADVLMTLFPLTMPYSPSRTEFSMWSMWSAPLITATHIANMSADHKSIIMNAEVIAIDQDPICRSAYFLRNDTHSGAAIWVKPLHNGDIAVAIMNREMFHNATTTVKWADVTAVVPSKGFSVRDCWEHKTLGVIASEVQVTVAPRDTVVYRLTPQS
jgi:alpha-galactosidase